MFTTDQQWLLGVEQAVLIGFNEATGETAAAFFDLAQAGRAGIDDLQRLKAILIVAATETTDHVLVGSANCTLAALGHESRPGINEEACLYRRLPGGRVLADLGLASIANDESTVDLAKLPPFDIGEALPLNDARARDPGIFEAVFDWLHWWPASPALVADIVGGSVAVEVTGDDDVTIVLTPDVAQASSRLPLTFLLPGKLGRPRLARVRETPGGGAASATVVMGFVGRQQGQKVERRSLPGQACGDGAVGR